MVHAPIIALIIIAAVSLIVVRIGTKALMMTGLGLDSASFQAYSAFFGVGFTTKEAELVVNHPVRRRIIRDLIFAGNVGLTSALATLVVTLMKTGQEDNGWLMLVLLVAGLVLVFLIFRLGVVKRVLDHWIHLSLERAGLIHAMDYELLLRIRHGYEVSQIEIEEKSFLEGRALRDSRPWDRGVVILAVWRDGETLPGLPGPTDQIRKGDVVTAYGKEDALKSMVGPVDDE
jgi:hypothetical protein